ncbi:MAG: efflux RND transporter periplasmic adaptor subunit, partial [Bacteroidota bacterium]|nr:efflux RND transporter periplasmic adaptor subunit [Bacteroidota bacterium]
LHDHFVVFFISITRKMKSDFFKVIFFILICSQACSCSSGKKKDKGNQNIVSFIEGIILKPTTVDETIQVSGTLKPFEETVLMSDISGRVVSLNLPEGQHVKKGTVLVKIFDGDLQAQLKKANTQLEIAQQILTRQTELLKVDGISQLEYDQQALQVNSIKDDIELLKVQISKTQVLAPYDGIIGLRNISLGAQITPSTPLATIRESNQLKLDFAVPGKYSTMIHPGTTVKFSVAGSDNKYDASVMATEEGIELNTRTLKARAVVKPTGTELVPGSYANVEIRLNENHNALMVPTQSIILQERNKQVIVSKGGKAVFTTVRTGVRQSNDIEVTEGLNPGDTIVTTGIMFIKSGSNLHFSKIK